MRRFYYFEILGTKKSYDEGKDFEIKRIGRKDDGLEQKIYEEVKRAIQEGQEIVNISVEKS